MPVESSELPRRDGVTTSSCFACGLAVTVAELRTRPPMFALVGEVSDAGSGYLLQLPHDATQLAAPFVASEFGSYRMHQCRVGAVGTSASLASGRAS